MHGAIAGQDWMRGYKIRQLAEFDPSPQPTPEGRGRLWDSSGAGYIFLAVCLPGSASFTFAHADHAGAFDLLSETILSGRQSCVMYTLIASRWSAVQK